MRETNMTSSSDLNTAQALRTILEKVGLTSDDEDSPASGSAQILGSALAALSERRVSEALEHFDDGFIFNDRALTLEFTEKARLTEYLQKSRDLFPDTTLEVIRVMESGEYAIAEWKLNATQTVPDGSISYRFPVSLHGATVARVKNGRIVKWSEVPMKNTSARGRKPIDSASRSDPDAIVFAEPSPHLRGDAERFRMSRPPTTNDSSIANGLYENPLVFRARFVRCYRVLHLIACRVLGGQERADEAIENCWLKGSANPPRFEYEGAFRSWLARVLIDEAPALLRNHEGSAPDQLAVRRDSFGLRDQLHEKPSVPLKVATEGEY